MLKKKPKVEGDKAAADPAKPEGADGAPAPAKAAGKKGPVKKALKPAAAKASKKPAKSAPARKAPPKPPRPPRGGLPFICSECYEEFILPATYSKETVSCPECLHVGKRPADDFLRTVTLHKSGERNALKMAITVTYMLVVSALILVWLISPKGVSALQAETHGTVTTVVGGLTVILVALLAWAVMRYEKNRWEVYF